MIKSKCYKQNCVQSSEVCGHEYFGFARLCYIFKCIQVSGKFSFGFLILVKCSRDFCSEAFTELRELINKR